MNPQRQRTVQLTVNGQVYQRQVPTRQLLADFLRQELHLTGTHVGCEHGVCGACTVLLTCCWRCRHRVRAWRPSKAWRRLMARYTLCSKRSSSAMPCSAVSAPRGF